ncbi:MAG: hypothetical protein ACTS5I_13680 [Rhodanobacter sp.]
MTQTIRQRSELHSAQTYSGNDMSQIIDRHKAHAADERVWVAWQCFIVGFIAGAAAAVIVGYL